MKKSNIFLSAMMVMLLVVMTACSNAGTTNGTGGKAEPGKETSSPSDAPYEIVLGYPVLGEVPADIDAVEAEINKITLAEINATVKLSRITIGQWFQQKNLILAGNEKMDLIVTDFESYSPAVSKNQFISLDELIAEHGSGIQEALGSNLDVAKINGSVYATPLKGFIDTGTAILMRQDLLDKHEIDASTIQGTNDLDAVFEKVKNGEPSMMMIAPPNGPMPLTSAIDWINVDTLTDGLGVLANDSAEMKVENLYEMPAYMEALKKIRSWYQAGYLPKDAANAKVAPQDLMKNGETFSIYEGNTVFLEDQISTTTNQQLVKTIIQKPILTTRNVLGLMWAIPQNTQNAEKAMEFLNLTFTNKDIINLINFGIEDKHYTKVSDNVISLIPDSGYRMNQGFMFGNRLLTYVLEGEDPELRVENDKFGETVERSKALGFLPNTEAVRTEVVAVNNVLEQYKKALETGSVDPEKVLPEFIEKLKAAGMDAIIAEKQKQLDEWVAQQQ